ncbi:MAG: hypothetical protein HY342_13535 [Candidatus Lambdaproteobacteria bacterium]|nr:hypothetical protein [Candidatus Lambdaproteobacteria bacterium]
MARHIERDHTRADLDEDDRAMLDFAAKLNRVPAAIGEGDIAALRGVGFSDEQIMDIVLVTALFNFNNRVILGLGIQPDAHLLAHRSARGD